MTTDANVLTLVLVRHGEAGTAPTDEARELTSTGRRAIRMLSADIQSRTLSPVAIRTSPARRAHQTAEIIFSALPDPGPIRPTTQLASGARLADLLAMLRAEKPGTGVIWVGHMPDLGRLAAFLLGRPGEVALRAGSAVSLSVDLGGPLPVGKEDWEWNP